MSIDTGDLLDTKPERKPGDFFRNRMGAPYVSHPTERTKAGEPKRVVYGRPSSFGTALDNAYNLIRWKERQLLIGASILEQDSNDRALEGDFLNLDPDDRDALDGLAARCHQAAGSSLAADRGTHVHLLVEQYDRYQTCEFTPVGEELGIPLALQQQIVRQWREFRYRLGVTALAIEATIVNDAWRLAGTLDRLDVCDRDILTGYGTIHAGIAFIGDIKTGSLTLGRDGQPNYWVKYPVQLAAYAGGVPYDVDIDERGRWSEYPHQEIAMIYHYDLARALDGELVDWQAIRVNLTAGREGGDLCRQAADFAKRRDLFLMPAPTVSSGFDDGAATTSSPAEQITPGGVSSSSSSPGVVDQVETFHIVGDDGRRGKVTIKASRAGIRDNLIHLIQDGHEALIRSWWPAGVPPLSQPGHTSEQLTAIWHLIRRVEAEIGAPFDPEPATPDPMPPVEPELPPAAIDDGAFLDQREIDLLRTRLEALPAERQQALSEIAAEASTAGRSISVQQKPCVRRWEIVRALVLWAEGSDDLEHLALVVSAHATVDQIRGNDTIGAVISTFTISQAETLADTFSQEAAA